VGTCFLLDDHCGPPAEHSLAIDRYFNGSY
jgi:hypothetical protein